MTQIPRAEPGNICPFHKKDMSKVCHTCPMWFHMRGKHPQVDEMIDDWRCSLAWMPMLLIENARQSMQTAASMDSMRNEFVQRMNPHLGPLENDAVLPMKTISHGN